MAFKTGKKDNKAYQNQALEDVPGNFNLQTDGALLAGTVMVQMGEYKSSREKEREDNIGSKDNQEKSFLRNFVHSGNIPGCFKIVNGNTASVGIDHPRPFLPEPDTIGRLILTFPFRVLGRGADFCRFFQKKVFFSENPLLSPFW
jgi:hypothetical protein